MVCQFVSKANEMVHGRGTVDVNRRYHQLRPGSTPRRVLSEIAICRQLRDISLQLSELPTPWTVREILSDFFLPSVLTG